MMYIFVQGKYHTMDGWTKDILEELYAKRISKYLNVIPEDSPLRAHNESPSVELWRKRLVDSPEWMPEGLKEFLLFYYFYDGQKPRVPITDLGLFGCYVCYGM